MKRVVLVAAVAMLALASCKKTYVCKYKVGTLDQEITYKDVKKSGKAAVETACDLVSGTLTVK